MENVKAESSFVRWGNRKNIMTKSSLPVGGYSVNHYVGCTHACTYCYASLWSALPDTRRNGALSLMWAMAEIKIKKKYAGQRVVIGSVTRWLQSTGGAIQEYLRKLLEQLIGSDADILICTKSRGSCGAGCRSAEELWTENRFIMVWSTHWIRKFQERYMDSASSIERRIAAMKTVPLWQVSVQSVSYPQYFRYHGFWSNLWAGKGISAICSGSKILIFRAVSKTIMDYIAEKHLILYHFTTGSITRNITIASLETLELKAAEINMIWQLWIMEMPYGRVQGHPVIVDWLPIMKSEGQRIPGKNR